MKRASSAGTGAPRPSRPRGDGARGVRHDGTGGDGEGTESDGNSRDFPPQFPGGDVRPAAAPCYLPSVSETDPNGTIAADAPIAGLETLPPSPGLVPGVAVQGLLAGTACEWCGGPFVRRPHAPRSQRYCCGACAANGQRWTRGARQSADARPWAGSSLWLLSRPDPPARPIRLAAGSCVVRGTVGALVEVRRDLAKALTDRAEVELSWTLRGEP